VNTWQALRQLTYLLAKQVWPDSPGEKVFRSVHATALPGAESSSALRMPFCLLRPINATADKQSPSLKTQGFEATIVTASTGDTLGEFALIGGQRNSQGSSRGRGLLEVEEVFYQTLDFLNQKSGIRIQVASNGSVEGEYLDGVGYVAARRYGLESLVGVDRDYLEANPRGLLVPLAALPLGGGQVQLSWDNPPERFDFNDETPIGGLVLRRASGATPPASPTSGTGITLVTGFEESITDTPGAGTFSYALFVGYNEGNWVRYSSAITVTSVVT